ncbi:hypothetical protein CYMTET_25042 [Cymbomonas tetramitiformis]|uniref:Uncharacterized protein n=1 Tax=Cymbomonas tetramitiformis TaxID=36881 RepID=A0AAE0KZB0_9CHLO|nr:hypothetical protein CYMTET_25042 [Cymbomonas tetramitiformis]
MTNQKCSSAIAGTKALVAESMESWYSCDAFNDLDFDLSNENKYRRYFNEDTKFRFHNLGNFTGGDALSDYLKLTTESSPYVASLTRTQFDYGFLGYTEGSKCVFMAYEALDYELTEYGDNEKFTVAAMMKINYDPELNKVTYVYVYYDEQFLEYFFGKLDTEATSDMICDTLETSCRSTWDSNGLADKDDCLARLGEMNLFTSGTKHEQYFDGYDRGCRMVHSVAAASNSDYCQALSFSAEEGYPMCQESADLPCCATISTGEAIFDEVEFAWFTQFKADYKIDIDDGYNEHTLGSLSLGCETQRSEQRVHASLKATKSVQQVLFVAGAPGFRHVLSADDCEQCSVCEGTVLGSGEEGTSAAVHTFKVDKSRDASDSFGKSFDMGSDSCDSADFHAMDLSTCWLSDVARINENKDHANVGGSIDIYSASDNTMRRRSLLLHDTNKETTSLPEALELELNETIREAMALISSIAGLEVQPEQVRLTAWDISALTLEAEAYHQMIAEMLAGYGIDYPFDDYSNQGRRLVQFLESRECLNVSADDDSDVVGNLSKISFGYTIDGLIATSDAKTVVNQVNISVISGELDRILRSSEGEMGVLLGCSFSKQILEPLASCADGSLPVCPDTMEAFLDDCTSAAQCTYPDDCCDDDTNLTDCCTSVAFNVTSSPTASPTAAVLMPPPPYSPPPSEVSDGDDDDDHDHGDHGEHEVVYTMAGMAFGFFMCVVCVALVAVVYMYNQKQKHQMLKMRSNNPMAGMPEDATLEARMKPGMVLNPAHSIQHAEHHTLQIDAYDSSVTSDYSDAWERSARKY